FRAGEHNLKITPRVTELAEMMRAVDGAYATDNLWGERWSKLSANAMSNPVQAMSGLGSLDIQSSEVGRAITIPLGAEGARAGPALGFNVPKYNGAEAAEWAAADTREGWNKLDTMLTPTSTSGRNWRASMAQDVAKGRPTEIDYMNGLVLAQAR